MSGAVESNRRPGCCKQSSDRWTTTAGKQFCKSVNNRRYRSNWRVIGTQSGSQRPLGHERAAEDEEILISSPRFLLCQCVVIK